MIGAGALGTPRVHLRQTESTNAVARRLAGLGAPHGTLVTAEHQTAGRGRQGRRWESPPGRSLLMSLLVREAPGLLPLRAGLAVAETCGAQARVKWPNDVLIGGRKVAGILVEGRPQEGWAVLGVGLNVAIGAEEFPEDLRGCAATMGLHPADVERVLGPLLAMLASWLAAPADEVLDAVRGRDALLDQAVSWAGGAGVAAGIDGHGRLIVVTYSGERLALDAGEVHLGHPVRE